MGKNYYYLVAGLPDLTINDNKLSTDLLHFKEEAEEGVSKADRSIVKLFYMRFDNANLLRLLKDADAQTDPRGNYSRDELNELIARVKSGDDTPNEEFPTYMWKFLADYFSAEAEGQPAKMLPEDRLAEKYHEYGAHCGNAFVEQWFAYSLQLNNLFAAIMARKLGLEPGNLVLGEDEVAQQMKTSGARDFGLAAEVEFMEEALKLCEDKDLVEREKKIDQMKWDRLEETGFFHYFGIEQIFAFLVKLEIVERWLTLDKEQGNKFFRELIDNLKNEAHIPEEFRQ